MMRALWGAALRGGALAAGCVGVMIVAGGRPADAVMLRPGLAPAAEGPAEVPPARPPVRVILDAPWTHASRTLAEEARAQARDAAAKAGGGLSGWR
ncbi:hypothetical protein [Methylobacterium isbiliense]|uniref:Uncharacterized protein n=1 Tax=Methylobacterium isbiliense TaxID=315478 RepID=A0ABQ4SAW0_9HYPH|nr:hypothetical protein [Methylobacterium isbiliense]MDN3623010.1 hypothetical protein [Methylobacterium isbiliense]GJE00342.1 hypothetical protein GMJLKIPL_2263 [Methylobacterium isbiliense]